MGILGGVMSLGGALIGASSADKAADAQEAAAREDLAFQKKMWRQTRKDLNPYRTTGTAAENHCVKQ